MSTIQKWNTPAESVYGVVGHMQLLQDYFFKHPKYYGLIPFLHTYYTVTKAVASKTNFKNPLALEQLDIHFASLYFNPIQQFLNNQIEHISPWKTYFAYCKKAKGNPFLEMLLGINAHINSDLTVTLYELSYREHHDFQMVNSILSDVIPDVMKFLVKEYHSLFALGAIVFPHFTHDEFTDIVVRWRNQAWDNAQRLQQLPRAEAIKNLHDQTENIAERLVQLFSSPEHFLLHKTELKSLQIIL